MYTFFFSFTRKWGKIRDMKRKDVFLSLPRTFFALLKLNKLAWIDQALKLLRGAYHAIYKSQNMSQRRVSLLFHFYCSIAKFLISLLLLLQIHIQCHRMTQNVCSLHRALGSSSFVYFIRLKAIQMEMFSLSIADFHNRILFRTFIHFDFLYVYTNIYRNMCICWLSIMICDEVFQHTEFVNTS